MNKSLFKEEFDNNFYKNYFGKKYLHKKKLIKNVNDIVSLEILDDMLSKTNIWKVPRVLGEATIGPGKAPEQLLRSLGVGILLGFMRIALDLVGFAGFNWI